MLKGYRKRFVLSNMLLVGVALMAALIVLGFFLYRSSYRGLRSTMQMVVTPWGDMGDRMREDPPEKPKDAPPEKPHPRTHIAICAREHVRLGKREAKGMV